MHSYHNLGECPNLCQLQSLKGHGSKQVKVMHEVTPHWKEVAITLGFDGPGIEAIDQTAFRNPEDACHEMFVRWLDEDNGLVPVTWGTLIQGLIDAGLVDVADSLKVCLNVSR